jgi:hypothetical protein
MKILIGADPEFFLQQNGKHKSAVGLIGGDKWNPVPIDDLGNCIQEDNVSVEFNIQPSETYEGFRSVIHKVLNHLKEKLNTYEFSKESAVSFEPEELQTQQAQIFGCEPDYNAWSKKINKKPYCEDKNLRSAGGHIHIGCELAQKKPLEIIKACDLFLGVPSVVMDPGTERRKLYGLAGSFRQKKYGVEYRSLSNWWIFSDDTIKWVFDNTHKAINFVANNQEINPEDTYTIQKCINTSDKNLYHQLMLKYNL